MDSNVTERRLLLATTHPGLARRVITGIALATVILVVSACGSSSNSAKTTTTSTGASGSTSSSTSAASSTSSTSSASGSASLSKIESQIETGQSATFVATYSVTASTQSTTMKLTLAHSGSDSLFGVVNTTGQFEEILAGTATDICVQESGSWHCYSGVGGAGAAFATMIKEFENAYSSTTLAQTLKADESTAVGTATSTNTIAGQPVTCVSYHLTTNSDHWTYCVTSQGVIAQAEGSASTGTFDMKMTKYSASVPNNEFTPPATPTTIP
jgi:hypothetical protein